MFLFGCLALAQTARSQHTSVPMQYYDRAQNARDKASDLYGKKNASPAEIAKGLQMLKNTILFFPLTYINKPNFLATKLN